MTLSDLTPFAPALPEPTRTLACQLAWGCLLGETLGRIASSEAVTEPMQQCFSALTALYADAQTGAKAETVGDWRVEYRTHDQTLAQRAHQLVWAYLGETDLLFRGICP